MGVIAMMIFEPHTLTSYAMEIAGLMGGATVLFVLGAFDDKMDLDCNFKLTVEILVAIVAVSLGWRAETILMPVGQKIHLGLFSYPFSVLWLVGIANAINMIDGLDGLAAGIAIVISIVTLAIAGLFGNPLVSTLSIILMGAIAGFLRYNMNPASIFMGDSGSLSLGFVLACISLNASAVEPGTSAFIVPLLLLGLPITDSFLAIARRLRRGIHPFHADREHIHHRLVRLGLSQPGAAMAMIGISMILGIMAFLVAQGIYADVKFFSHFANTP
jgi:UDP-GlcNAc:undecaprenyl-phosphate GlcNAc-1-phosphate transferase